MIYDKNIWKTIKHYLPDQLLSRNKIHRNEKDDMIKSNFEPAELLIIEKPEKFLSIKPLIQVLKTSRT